MIPESYKFVVVFTPHEGTDLQELETELLHLLWYYNPQTRRAGSVGILPEGDGLYRLQATRPEKFGWKEISEATNLVAQQSSEMFFIWDNNEDSAPGHFHLISIFTNIMFGGRNSVKEALQAQITKSATRAGLISREGDSGYTNGVMTVVLQSPRPITQKQLDKVLKSIATIKDRLGKSYPVIMGREAPPQLPLVERFFDWLRWKRRGY